INREKTAKVSRLHVDTGSEFTWISEKTLAKIGVEPEKKDIPFVMAKGQSITRTVGFAIIHVNKAFTIDEAVFAQKGDMQLLGARSLEGLNLRVDSKGKKLVAAGPVNAANVSFCYLTKQAGQICKIQ
ncbi:MAG: aspartyl protease family protein, partial [Thermodesulfobacteriota bacterium]